MNDFQTCKEIMNFFKKEILVELRFEVFCEV